MAIDRQQKKKKKRDQRRKDRRIRTEQKQRHENAEFYSYHANEAYYNGDYISAHTLSLKSLKIDPSDEYIREIAMKCAVFLKQEISLFPILLQCYRNGYILMREEYLLLGNLAFARKNYELVREIFKGLLSEDLFIERPLTKVQLKKVERTLNDCDILERAEEMLKKLPASSTLHKPKEKIKQSSEASPVPPSDSDKIKEDKKNEQLVEEIRLEPKITYQIKPEPVISAIKEIRRSNISSLETTLQAYKLSFRTSYEQLLCLPTLQNVQSLWYQEETARKVLKNFRGRAILSDEVGLGKTIEACMCLKEYIMRGLVKTVLILTPSNLVRQWQEELWEKFALRAPRYTGKTYLDVDGNELTTGAVNPWNGFDVLLASSHLARRRARQGEILSAEPWDIVLVDEAHHAGRKGSKPDDQPNRLLELLLKMRAADKWLVLYLASATPMQMHAHEAWDLLELTDLDGRWAESAGTFERYYQELAEPPMSRSWPFSSRLLCWAFWRAWR